MHFLLMICKDQPKESHHRIDDHPVSKTMQYKSRDRKTNHTNTHCKDGPVVLRDIFIFSYCKEITETNPVEKKIHRHPQKKSNDTKFNEYL